MSRFGKSVVKLLTNDRKTISQSTVTAAAIEHENEKCEVLKLSKTLRYGFPYDPTSIAYDLVQHLLAIGTRNGVVKIYGGQTIEASITHTTQSSVLFMTFVVNEGALITYCEDCTLSFWNLRQKQPAASFSRKLIIEKATAIYLPFQNKWLYLGTEKGNVYVLNVYNNFSQSGYDIKWNNVIELSQKTHPGRIIHLTDHPLDSSKLLMAYETGLIVLWNVKNKKAEFRFNGQIDGNLSSLSWFYDGKQFMCSYDNGYLATWCIKSELKPVTCTRPHYDDTDLVRIYNKIEKISWEATKNGESMYIFSNGLPQQSSMKDAITICKNKSNKIVVEMKEKIVDFLVVRSTPWVTDEPNEALAIIVLLTNDLVIIDLKSEGYPKFEHHHSIDLHSSALSYYDYIIDPDFKLLQHLLVSKEKESKMQTNNALNFSTLQYPITGGIKGSKTNMFPYNELIVTGHEDGTVKLWEASGICLEFIYEIKTYKVFDKRRCETNSFEIHYPYKISNVCLQSDYLAVSGIGGHVTLFKYISKKSNPVDEELTDIPILDIPYCYESPNEKSQNDTSSNLSSSANQSSNEHQNNNKKDIKSLLRVKIGYKRQQGYQPELVCLFLWSQKPPVVNNLAINSKYSLLVIGTDESIICVDYQSRTALINVQICDYFGVQDLCAKIPKSPKKSKTTSESILCEDDDNPNTPLHFFNSKQLTFDSSHYANIQRTIDAAFKDTSRTPSSSSLENVILNEGCSCVAFNEQTQSLNPSNHTTYLWIGTTYGSIIVFTINPINNDIINNSMNKDSINLNTSIDLKQILLTPSISKHSLKGQIIHISFLDSNFNVLQPKLNSPTSVNTNLNSSTNSNLSTNSSALSLSAMQNNINNNGSNVATPTSDINSPSALTNFNPTIATTSNTFSHTYAADDSKIPSKPQKSFLNAILEPLISTRSARIETSMLESPDKNQYAVICSEIEVEVLLLPSQVCLHKYSFDDDTIIAKATVSSINNVSYLLCYAINGNLITFNLPSLKLNSCQSVNSNDKDRDELIRLAKTFTFGSKGHAFYMCTPSEIQKFIISSNPSHGLTEMLPELFDPKINMPIAPKPSLFKTIFSNNPQLDREQLFGETSGKPSTSIVQKSLDNEITRNKNELSELQKLALQRGEKLSNLEKKTEEMTNQAMSLAKNAHDLANKYKKKSHWF